VPQQQVIRAVTRNLLVALVTQRRQVQTGEQILAPAQQYGALRQV
jgi:hypothetical protein